MKTLANIFLKGLLFALPIFVTFGLLYWIFAVAETYLRVPLEFILPRGWYITGMGVVSAIGLIFLLGLLVQAYLVSSVLNYLVSLIERIPVVKTLYNSTKDLLNFIAGGQNKQMQRVVSITFDNDVQLIGFVTSENVTLGDQNDLVTVYLPMSYQIGGYTIYVPRHRLTQLDMPVQRAMQTILTANVTSGENHNGHNASKNENK